jgi:hypothetical protein
MHDDTHKLFHKKIIGGEDEFEISHLRKLPLTVRGGQHFTFELNATDEEDNHPTPADLTHQNSSQNQSIDKKIVPSTTRNSTGFKFALQKAGRTKQVSVDFNSEQKAKVKDKSIKAASSQL